MQVMHLTRRTEAGSSTAITHTKAPTCAKAARLGRSAPLRVLLAPCTLAALQGACSMVDVILPYLFTAQGIQSSAPSGSASESAQGFCCSGLLVGTFEAPTHSRRAVKGLSAFEPAHDGDPTVGAHGY